MNIDLTKITSDILLILLPTITTYIGIRYKSWNMTRKANRFMVKYHSIFYSLSSFKREVKRWNIKENRQVFKDALLIQIECWQKKGFEITDLIDKETMQNSKLEKTLIDWVNSTINAYNNEWVKSKIPNEVIQRINLANADKLEQFINDISAKVHNDEQYPFYKTKVTSILDVLTTLLSEIINDFNQLIYREYYNGSMRGVYYLGLPVSDLEYAEKMTINPKNN